MKDLPNHSPWCKLLLLTNNWTIEFLFDVCTVHPVGFYSLYHILKCGILWNQNQGDLMQSVYTAETTLYEQRCKIFCAVLPEVAFSESFIQWNFSTEKTHICMISNQADISICHLSNADPNTQWMLAGLYFCALFSVTKMFICFLKQDFFFQGPTSFLINAFFKYLVAFWWNMTWCIITVKTNIFVAELKEQILYWYFIKQ